MLYNIGAAGPNLLSEFIVRLAHLVEKDSSNVTGTKLQIDVETSMMLNGKPITFAVNDDPKSSKTVLRPGVTVVYPRPGPDFC